jgi:hypothetical protein
VVAAIVVAKRRSANVTPSEGTEERTPESVAS